jgi:hypothetical protein
MDLEAIPTDLPTPNSTLTRLFYLFVMMPTLLGMTHHVDHIIRGNHVGWPLTNHVNTFTYSLAIYPLIAVGFYLTLTDRVGARYWTGFFLFSAGMLAFLHIGPWAVEPPGDVILPYANPMVGYVAFGVLLALIASVCLGGIYAGLLWYRGETALSAE